MGMSKGYWLLAGMSSVCTANPNSIPVGLSAALGADSWDLFHGGSRFSLPPPGRVCRGMLFQEGMVEERSCGVQMRVLSSVVGGIQTPLPCCW